MSAKRIEILRPTSTLYRHVTYQNDPLTKPDFTLVFPDPYLRPCRRQGRRRLPPHHHEPQGPSYMFILYIKMILSSSQTSCWCFQMPTPFFQKSTDTFVRGTCMRHVYLYYMTYMSTSFGSSPSS